MTRAEVMAAFAALARDLDNVDREVYAQFGRDPTEAIVGEGPGDAPLAVFGRDPGREEVRHGLPFVGAGGQKVRTQLHEAFTGKPMETFEESLAAGRGIWWANTVPFKPIGNKAWSQKVKKAFFPYMSWLLLNGWRGKDVITLGREAFFWFGLGADKAQRAELDVFWRRQDRFETWLEVPLVSPLGSARTLRLHPLPHPSPLNATWYARFPDLLRARLNGLL